MSKTEKPEIDSIWEEATKAKDFATRAKAKAAHAAAVVAVSHETLATATKNAAEAHLASEEADRHALEIASKARQALEEHLGIPGQEQAPVSAKTLAPKVP